jgi:hypothetical protein
LTPTTGDLLEVGDERQQTMEQVVLKPGNLPEQLRIIVTDLKWEDPSRNQWREAYDGGYVARKAVNSEKHGTSMKEITVAECSENHGQQ